MGEVGAQQLPVVLGIAKLRKVGGLEATDGMGWRKQVVPDLFRFDQSAVSIGEQHASTTAYRCSRTSSRPSAGVASKQKAAQKMCQGAGLWTAPLPAGEWTQPLCSETGHDTAVA